MLLGGGAAAAVAAGAWWVQSNRTQPNEPDGSPSPSKPSSPGKSPSSNGAFPGDPGDEVYVGISLQIDQPVSERESQIGAKPTISRRFYKDHQTGLMTSMAAQDLQAGVLPFLSMKVPGSWASVASGDRDDWLDDVLKGLAQVDGPVFMAFHHEPENDLTLPGHTPGTWKQMQQRARDRAARIAPEVTIVPVLMQWTFNPESGRKPEEWLLPDFAMLGVDVYNIWSPADPKVWSEFADLLAQVRAFVPQDQAIIVPEFGTPPDPLDPQRASEWLRGAYQSSIGGNVAGLAWFDSPFNDPGIGNTQLSPVGYATLKELIQRPETARLS